MADPPAARSSRFLLLYALAWVGASISYTPFLTILLPVRVTALIGAEQAVSWLAYIAFTGAIAASLGHVLFGYLSDVSGNRRGWIAAGLALSCFLLLAVPWAVSLGRLIGWIICWQLGVNMMLAPLAALAGDRVPDSRKGVLGGLMAFAPGFGALSGALVTIPGLATADARLGLVAGLVALCVLPVVIFGGKGDGEVAPQPGEAARSPAVRRGALWRMWLARLTVQIGEAVLFAFLYLWFRSVDPGMTDNRTAAVFSAVLLLSAPLALAIGRWADRRGRPILPLVLCAAVAALGLTGMALADGGAAAIATYAVFGIASSIFLAQHSAQTLRVLPRPERRGRDLGLFNLTNTLPSLIMPWFALSLVPGFGFPALFVLLAGLSVVTSLLLAPLARRA